jgi:signal transduction histidine kinase
VIAFLKRRWTIRVRLTVLYGGLFFIAGALMLGVTYVLLGERVDNLPQGSLPDADPATLAQLRLRQEAFRDSTMTSLLTQGGLALAGVGVVATAFGWLLAGRALRPINRITETTRRIAGADGAGRGLHERIALAGPPDEVKQLADTFDLMLERLDRSFEGQRRFVASASHEMRTPLAINRALIEVAVTRPAASADARELGTALLDVNARHERLVDGLLTLADSDNEVVERHPVDLAELVGHVLAGSRAAAGTAGVEIRPTDLSSAPATGDPYLLERLVQNLVENAIRHNLPRDGWVSARTWAIPGRARLEVTNTGPEIHRYETELLFQPFRRLNGSGAAPDSGRGFGLGLSIVRAITRSHGGEVHAEPRDGGGLTVTVSLPLA